MQCTSYIPVYYHARDLNVGVSGFSLHQFDDANCGEKRSYNIAMPPYNMEQYLGYDKEVLKQIIQNHEATFRYQVQELHRLYRRQSELMHEMKLREMFAQHSWPHARPEFSQTHSHATSWLLGDPPCTIQRPSIFVAENYQECTTAQPDSFIRKNSYNDFKFLSTSSKGNESRIVDLELPADMHHDDQGKQFKEGNLSEASKKLPDFQPANSDIGSVKTGDSSSLNSNSRKRDCFIDLNEPVQLESLPSSSSDPFETCHMEIIHNNPCVPMEAIPKSVVPKDSGLLDGDYCSDGINSSVAIDLNSMPIFEAEKTLENLRSMNNETTVVLHGGPACNHAMRNGKCAEDHPIIDNKINDKFVRTETCIDLNTDVVDEHHRSLSSSVLQIKSAEDIELEGPVSPENEECSPPRGKSEDIQVETPRLSEHGEAEPFMELDTIAAQALVMISSGVKEYVNAGMAEPLLNFKNSLCWFAEIVSSTGDDLENEILKLRNDGADNDQGVIPSHGAYDFGASTLNSEENALNCSHVKKEKEAGVLSSRSRKGRPKGTKQCKKFQTELLPSLISLSEDLHTIEGFLETGPLMRKAGRKACTKPRKYSKLSHADVVKKSMSSILKQPATRSRQGVLQGWGKIRKRQGGRRRRFSKFLLIG